MRPMPCAPAPPCTRACCRAGTWALSWARAAISGALRIPRVNCTVLGLWRSPMSRGVTMPSTRSCPPPARGGCCAGPSAPEHPAHWPGVADIANRCWQCAVTAGRVKTLRHHAVAQIAVGDDAAQHVALASAAPRTHRRRAWPGRPSGWKRRAASSRAHGQSVSTGRCWQPRGVGGEAGSGKGGSGHRIFLAGTVLSWGFSAFQGVPFALEHRKNISQDVLPK